MGVAARKRKEAGLFYPEKLAILPQVRRRGQGRAMVEHCAGEARRAEGRRLSVGAMYETRRLVGGNERAAFLRTGTKNFPPPPFVVRFMESPLAEWD